MQRQTKYFLRVTPRTRDHDLSENRAFRERAGFRKFQDRRQGNSAFRALTDFCLNATMAKKGQASRSAVTGHFVSKDYAKTHPKTTVTETIKRGATKSR